MGGNGVRFFFSSRRRHTRFDCDWSSDVCSSDLEMRSPFSSACLGVVLAGVVIVAPARSEERRVGKECRSRWWPDSLKKKRNRTQSEASETSTGLIWSELRIVIRMHETD